MKIEIIGAESMGVRSLCCFVETGERRVISAAAFMERDPLPLEALRKKLYSRVPVPERWHKDYRAGRTGTRPFREWLKHGASDFVTEQILNWNEEQKRL